MTLWAGCWHGRLDHPLQQFFWVAIRVTGGRGHHVSEEIVIRFIIEDVGDDCGADDDFDDDELP